MKAHEAPTGPPPEPVLTAELDPTTAVDELVTVEEPAAVEAVDTATVVDEAAAPPAPPVLVVELPLVVSPWTTG
jgi:hypothetical protein